KLGEVAVTVAAHAARRASSSYEKRRIEYLGPQYITDRRRRLEVQGEVGRPRRTGTVTVCDKTGGTLPVRKPVSADKLTCPHIKADLQPSYIGSVEILQRF